jgi:hypothetical protein
MNIRLIIRMGVALLISLTSLSAWATPAQIVILRHGEKPANGNDLSPQGYQRANALPGLFKSDPALLHFGTPAAVYAMGPKGPDGTERPIETVTPLAQALGLTLQDQFDKKDIQDLVTEVMTDPKYDGKMVVICWEHSTIPEIAQDFGAANVPAVWLGNVFDRLWVLDFTGNKVTKFQDLPQDLLPGDSKI